MRTLIIAVLLLGLTVPAVQAQPMMGRGREMKKQLNLTDEQAETLKDIRTKSAKQLVDISSSIKKKAIDLKALMAEESPDRAAVKTLMTDISALKVERNMLLFDTRTATMNVLTPEQQEKMQELREKNGRKMMKKFKGHKRGPQPGMRGGMMDSGHPGPPMGLIDEELPPPPTE